MKENKYDEVLKDLEEKRTVKTEDGKEVEVEYEHKPNVIGRRSVYTGLPIWVGETTAKGNLDGGTEVVTVAKCWLREPYTYSRGRIVSTGRILKQLGLPTSLAEQVEE